MQRDATIYALALQQSDGTIGTDRMTGGWISRYGLRESHVGTGTAGKTFMPGHAFSSTRHCAQTLATMLEQGIILLQVNQEWSLFQNNWRQIGSAYVMSSTYPLFLTNPNSRKKVAWDCSWAAELFQWCPVAAGSMESMAFRDHLQETTSNSIKQTTRSQGLQNVFHTDKIRCMLIDYMLLAFPVRIRNWHLNSFF